MIVVARTMNSTRGLCRRTCARERTQSVREVGEDVVVVRLQCVLGNAHDPDVRGGCCGSCAER